MTRYAGRTGPWLVAGVIAWLGVAWLGWALWQQQPPRAGFDLALLLEAARRVLAGMSPYDPAMLAGASPEATGLFYSYPPPVAQAMTLVAWLPDGVVLVLWGVGATACAALLVALIARAAGHPPRTAAIRTAATLPLVLPFAVAILFGNLDAWYPLAYGALVLVVLPNRSRPAVIGAGIAIGIISVAKLHPASLLVWLAVRAWLERGGPYARALAIAALTGTAIVAASLVVGGLGPWQDYIAVARAGAGADLVDPRNMGPVSLLGQAFAIDAGGLPMVQLVVSVAAVAGTALAALRVRDPLGSLAIAVALSLVTLPVTWYHYPVACIPLAAALALTRPRTRPWIVAALVIADLAIGLDALLWVAIAVLVFAALWPRDTSQTVVPMTQHDTRPRAPT
jgi:Glycosyltransferase family 87